MNVDYSKLKFVFKPKASTKRRAPTVLPNKKVTIVFTLSLLIILTDLQKILI